MTTLTVSSRTRRLMIRAVLSLLLLAGSLFGQSIYRLRLPHQDWNAQLRGVSGTTTDGVTVSGTFDSWYGSHAFPIVTTGLYTLYTDPAGGASYTLDTNWDGASYTGKVIIGSDLAVPGNGVVFIYDSLSVSSTSAYGPVFHMRNVNDYGHPELSFGNLDSDPAAGDTIMRKRYYGWDEIGQYTEFVNEFIGIDYEGDGNEAGYYDLKVKLNGDLASFMRMEGRNTSSSNGAIFLNGDSNSVSLVYRSADGDSLLVIDPDGEEVTVSGNFYADTYGTAGNISNTELSYLNNAASNLQTQINLRQPLVDFVSDVEIGYLDGVTSAIQTQINSKVNIADSTGQAEGSYATRKAIIDTAQAIRISFASADLFKVNIADSTGQGEGSYRSGKAIDDSTAAIRADFATADDFKVNIADSTGTSEGSYRSGKAIEDTSDAHMALFINKEGTVDFEADQSFGSNYALDLQNISDQGGSGASYRFDGVDDYVQVSDDATIQDVFDNGGAVSCWIFPKSAGESDIGRIVKKFSVGNGFTWNAAGLSGNNIRLRFYYDFSTTPGYWTTSYSVPINTWSHVCVVYDNSSASNTPIIYINSVPFYIGSGLTEDVTPVGTRSTDVGQVLYIGGEDKTWDGQISEVRLHNHALTADEVATLYSGAETEYKYEGASQTDLVTNGGFETAGGGGADIWANWIETVSDGALTNETSIVHSGSDAAKLTAGSLEATTIYQTGITVIPGKRYLFSCYSYGDGTYAGRIRIYDESNSSDILAYTSTGITTAAYSMYSYEFTAPAGCTSIRTYNRCAPNNGSIVYFDDNSVVQIGEVCAYRPKDVTPTVWYDASGNGNDGTVSGAELVNVNHTGYFSDGLQVGAVKDSAVTVPSLHTTGGLKVDQVTVLENTTAPTSSPADVVQIYAADVSTSSELHVRDEAGNVTQLSANIENPPDYMETSEIYPYVEQESNVYAGITTLLSKHRLAELVQEWAWETGRLDTNKYIIRHIKTTAEDWTGNEELKAQKVLKEIRLEYIKSDSIEVLFHEAGYTESDTVSTMNQDSTFSDTIVVYEKLHSGFWQIGEKYFRRPNQEEAESNVINTYNKKPKPEWMEKAKEALDDLKITKSLTETSL